MRTAGRTAGAALVAGALLLALGPSASEARTSLRRQFEQAQARFHSLTQSPAERLRPELWDQAEARFRAIVDASPAGGWADDATYLLAEVYHARFHTFHREFDLDRAIETYAGLVEDHPGSPYADDALVRLGEIHYYQLRDPDGALRFYRRVLRDHPGGDMADQARTRMVAIERRFPRSRLSVDRNEATVGARALPGTPLLSSPGAVIGGRINSRVPAELLRKTLVPEAPRDAEEMGEATAPPPPRREEGFASPPAIEESAAPPLVPAEDREPQAPRAMDARPEAQGGPLRTAPSRPLNPLLEEGPIPLRTPADRLPVLAPAGPRSRAIISEVT